MRLKVDLYMETNSYFNVGTPESPVVSSSSFHAINPEEGGSIVKFRNFFHEKDEEKHSLSLDRGKLVHKYQEDPDKFVVEDFEAPTDMMSGLLERTIQLCDAHTKGVFEHRDINTTITSENKVEKNKNAEILETFAFYQRFAELLALSVEDTIRIFRTARIEKKAYLRRNESSLLGEILNGEKEIPYLKFLQNSRTKHVLKKETKEKVEGAIQALYTHPKVSALLGLRNPNSDFESTDVNGLVSKIYSELPIFWSEQVSTFDIDKVVRVNCKALLDKLKVNHSSKIITYVDLKTTAYSIYKYQEAFEKYRTYRQVAFYVRAIVKWFEVMFPDKNIKEYTLEVFIVPVETNGSYLTTIYEVSQPWLFKGKTEYVSLLSRVAWHYNTGEMRYSYEEIKGNGILKLPNPIK